MIRVPVRDSVVEGCAAYPALPILRGPKCEKNFCCYEKYSC